MITITNNKIRGFVPRWTSYRGFSLLFDNPGKKNLSPLQNDFLKIDCAVKKSKHLSLYRGLAASCRELEKQHRLTTAYLFCPLPPQSYHVTLWDGLNDGSLQTVSSGIRPALKKFLQNLPQSLLTGQEFTDIILISPPITFAFDKLCKWGNNSLVARLKPTQKLKQLIIKRQVLSAQFHERFGVTMRSEYSPHVTLGYFANQELAELTTPQIDCWTQEIKKRMKHLSITFTGISLYGFTDMVTFFKRKK